MARPLKGGLAYFPHDVNASTDKKIEALRTLHGNNAYVFYFVMLEQIYQEPNFELDISDAETREEMIQILAKKVQVTVDEFKQLLDTALRWSCFDKKLFDEKGILTSNGIKKRAEPVLAKRQQMRDRYHSAKERISDAETTPETGSETSQSKEKKSKRKDKEYSHDSQEYLLAEYLFKKIRENNSTFKSPNLQKWAKDIDLMLQIDGRPPEEVKAVVSFAQTDSFWIPNILSAGKLRKQYDTLKMQMQQKNPKANLGSANSILGLDEGVTVEV